MGSGGKESRSQHLVDDREEADAWRNIVGRPFGVGFEQISLTLQLPLSAPEVFSSATECPGTTR